MRKKGERETLKEEKEGKEESEGRREVEVILMRRKD